MPLRCHTRRALSVFCLVTLPGLALAADERNPFAEWDRLRTQTGITETRGLERPPTSGASLEYFSGTPAATPARPAGNSVPEGPRGPLSRPAESAEPAAVSESRSRLRMLQPEPPAAGSQTPLRQPAAEPQFAAQPQLSPTPQFSPGPQFSAEAPASSGQLAWPSSFQVHPSNKADAAAAQADPTEAGSVRSAAVSAADSEQNQIQLISTQKADHEETNPFAEFLETQAPAQTRPAPGTAAPAIAAVETAVRPSQDFHDGSLSATTGPQSPAVTLQWVQHGDFNVGQECRCDLLIRNASESAVRNVVAEAVIPDGLQVLQSEPAPAATGETAVWTFAELAAGDERRVELTVVPLARGGMQLNAFVRFTGFAASVFTVQEPLLQLSVDGPAQVEVGQQVSYVVSVTNPGNGIARNVTIQAAIPEGLEHRRGSLLTIEIGTLNPGESRQARLSVAAIQGGPQDMAVRATAEGDLSDQTTTSVTVAEPKLSIAVVGPQQRIAGQSTHYKLIVANEGNVASNNVRAKYRVPEGYEFVEADRGGKFTEADRTIDWFVGTLKAGGDSSFQVTLRPVTPGTTVHQAGVVSEHGKVTMAEHSTTVEGVAELALSVTADSQQVTIGEEAVFEVKIENNGSQAASHVGLSCELPFGLELLQAAGPSEYIAENGVLVFRSIPTLEPGQSAVFAIQSRCRREGAHSLRVRVASESITEPLIGEETTTAVSR